MSRPDVPNARASTTLTPLPRSTACSMRTWYSNSTLALLTMPVNQHQVLIVLLTKAVVAVQLLFVVFGKSGETKSKTVSLRDL